MIRTRLTRLFGIEHPVVLAPMALVSGGALAQAVSAAGGLGLVGGGYAGTLGQEPDLDEEIARARTGGRWGIGFIGWALAQVPDVLDRALAARPDCVFLSFADPRLFAPRVHAAGARLACQVQYLAQVDAALDAGAAVIVAQGTEAGGHGASRSTLPFVPEVVDYVDRHAPETLVLAAGGIADGRTLAAALLLGADGVVVGTRFWAAAEALTPVAATDRALAATGDGTVRTRAVDALRGVPWPAEYSFRLLRNRLTDAWEGREHEALAARGSLAAEYAAARARGDFDIVAAVAGEAVGLIDDRPPAATLLERMVRDAALRLRAGAHLDFTR